MTRVYFGFKSADTIRKIREVLEPRFVATFREFQNEKFPSLQEFDCVVPLGLFDYKPLRELERRSAGNFLIPNADTVATAHDKPAFAEFLVSNGFERCVPPIFAERVEYPFVYKKRKDRAGMNSFIISSPEQSAELESRIDARQYFKQQFVAGRTEYTTHILMAAGHVRYVSTFEFGFNVDHFVKGKIYPISKRQVENPFLGTFRNILNAFEFSGTCCFNYKIVGGAPKIFELNPRFGGSLVGDIHAYLDSYAAVLAERRSCRRRRARLRNPRAIRDQWQYR